MKIRIYDESIELKDNAMLKVRPELFYEWDFEKNDELGTNVYRVTFGNNKEVWWLGECGHEFYGRISKRVEGSKCPYCSNRKVLIGYNDMWTTNPELASLLLNPEDGYKYVQGSNTKVDWKCDECDNIIKNKSIKDTNIQGLPCAKCSDGIKFPEKFMYNLLKEANIDFNFDIKQIWSQGKRYDFYLSKYNWIIEVHGGQHYIKQGYHSLGGRLLREEQENDRLKERMAKENGITNYITIDARYSTVKWMKNNILNSDIMKIVGKVDFEEIGRLASKSFVRDVCNLWSSGDWSSTEIAEKTSLSKSSVLSYLKRGAEIGWCDYDSIEAKRISSQKNGTQRRYRTIQLTKEGVFIKEWRSAMEAGKALGVRGNSPGVNISSVCNGRRKTTAGFKWMYAEDYEKL